MQQSEAAQRVVLLTRMFDAYGQTPTPSRVDAYLEVVGGVPLEALEPAIRDAMREAGDYPPGPGTIRRHALATAQMRPGDPEPHHAGDTFPRIGPGDAPIGALFSGLERRVERNYQRVIARAREIVRERRLPASLDARIWSLGEAERELGWIDTPCACWPRCGPELDRRLEVQRHAAGVRCGAVRAIAAEVAA